MLTAMREGANSWPVRILLILIIASFALWGVQTGTLGGASAVSSVGDERVTQQEYSRLFNREFSRLQSEREGPYTVDDAVADGLDTAILDRLTLAAALDQGAVDTGLRVSDKRVADEIQRLPIFVDPDGNFDKVTYELELRNRQHTTSSFEREVRKDLARADLVETMIDGVVVPQAMIDALYEFQTEGRTAEYFVVSGAGITDIPRPSDEELQAFYDANQDDYMRPEYRRLTYLTLQPEDVADQVEITEELIQEAYNDRLDEFGGGETRALKQITVQSEEQARDVYNAAVGGADFFELAADAGLSRAEVDLGSVDRGAVEYLGDDAVNAAFNATEGTATEPVETALGWIVFQVDEITGTQTTSLEDVREEIVAEVTEREAGYKLDDLVALANEELTAGATVEDLADTLSLQAITIEEVSREGRDRRGDVVTNVPASAAFFDSAFARGVDEFLDLEEDGDNGFFVVRVDDITPAEPRPFRDVKRQVEDAWYADARQTAAQDLSENLAEEVRAGKDMREAAESVGALLTTTPSPFYRTLQNRPAPFSLDIVNNMFAAKDGEIVNGLNAFGNGFVIAKLTGIRKTAIDRDSESYAATRQAIEQSLRNDVFLQFEAHIYDEHSTSRNPALISQMLNTQQ